MDDILSKLTIEERLKICRVLENPERFILVMPNIKDVKAFWVEDNPEELENYIEKLNPEWNYSYASDLA